MKVVASYSIKGGVGKTAAVVNLAAEAAADGQRVLLWDLDPQGAASFHLVQDARLKGGAAAVIADHKHLIRRVRGTHWPRLHLIPSDFSHRRLDTLLSESKRPERHIKRLLKPLRGNYDLVLLDCAPSISLTAESIFHAADALLVPVIPSALSLRTLQQLADFLAGMPDDAPQLLAFFSMFDRRRRVHQFTINHPPRKLAEFFDAAIPNTAQVERMSTRGSPLRDFSLRCPAALAYAALWRELARRLDL